MWVVRRLGYALGGGPYCAIGLERGFDLIGGVVYTNYCGGSIAANIAGTGTGWITRPFIRAAFAYPFMQLRVRRLSVFVAKRNVISRKFVERLGFELESTMERATEDDDMLIYRMFNEDCLWLR
jgi:RimJ/RimL family protein N-acetyltransferase